MKTEQDDRCFLCDGNARQAEGVAFFRFFDPVDERWVSAPICAVCWMKLKGN